MDPILPKHKYASMPMPDPLPPLVECTLEAFRKPTPPLPPAFLLRSLTCVFLASKTEEQITNVNLLAKATGRDDLHILGKELTLLQVCARDFGGRLKSDCW